MSNSRWKLVETVVTAIEGAEPNAKVTANAMVASRTNPEERRQVDVYVENQVGRRLVRLGVEVKNERSPLDVTTIEQVGAKLSDLELDLGHLVSTSGFTTLAESKAARMGLSLSTLKEIEEKGLGPLTFFRHSAEPLHVRIVYPGGIAPEGLSEETGKTDLDAWLLEDTNGGVASIWKFALAYGLKSLDMIEQPLQPLQPYSIEVRLAPEQWKLMKVAGRRFPVPESLIIIYRLHEDAVSLATASYELDGREVHMTTEPVDVFGKLRHLGLLLAPAEDGGKRVKFTFTLPRQAPISVGGEGDEV